jgi:aspartate/methionine/tyrosine aminotransferase
MSAPAPQHSHFMRAVLEDIRHNPGAEMVRYARRRAEILSLARGASEAPTPAFIRDAVNTALAAGQTTYGPVLGRTDLRQAIVDYHRDIFGHELTLPRVVVTSSGTSAIHLALTSVLEKGDEVVTVFPLWKNLLGALRLQQAHVRGVNLTETENGWELDLDALFAAVTDKTRAIVINSPNNPTGWVMKTDQMRAVMDFARARGLWVIADEVYGRLVFDAPRAPSFLDVAEPDDRLFVINSFSKNWAMTGWRLGWLVGPAAAEQKIYDLVLYDNMGPPNFTQAGGIAALRGGEDFIAQQKAVFAANRDAVMAFFAQYPRVKASVPESSFYTFFRVEGEDDCMAFARRLIDDVALGLAPGCAFGRNFAGYQRLCYAVSRPHLDNALDRLGRALKG